MRKTLLINLKIAPKWGNNRNTETFPQKLLSFEQGWFEQKPRTPSRIVTYTFATIRFRQFCH